MLERQPESRMRTTQRQNAFNPLLSEQKKLLYGLIKDRFERAGAQRWKRLQSFHHKLLVAMCGSKNLYVEGIIKGCKKPRRVDYGLNLRAGG